MERIRNEEIKQRMSIERTIIDIMQKLLKKKKEIWYGHVQRMKNDRLLKQVIKWILLEKRKHG